MLTYLYHDRDTMIALRAKQADEFADLAATHTEQRFELQKKIRRSDRDLPITEENF